jgi:hypothetical protein
MNIYLIAGVWDCGGALVVFLRFASSSKDGKNDKLLLHCSETNQLEVLNLPRSITRLNGQIIAFAHVTGEHRRRAQPR